MKRILLLSALVMGLISANAQTWTNVGGRWGYEWLRTTKALFIPSGNGAPSGTASLFGAGYKGQAAFYSDTSAKKLYMFNPKDSTWLDITGSVGGGITALTGDVIASGSGSVGATISNNAVTASKINNGAITIPKLNATGTPDNTTFLRGDNTWSVPPGAGSGINAFTAIGSAPNANGASVSGSNGTLQPASGSFGGVVTTLPQTFAGNKSFLGKTSNFNGLGPRLNAQFMAPAKGMDSIYVSGKYLGFGFCGVFKSGVRVIVFVKADNHVGGSSIVMIGKSYNQGISYTIDTLLNQLHGGVNDTLITMGGGGIGPDNRLIVFYKRFRFSSPTFFPIDQRIALSDDEGSTLTSDIAVSNNGNDEYLPYGGLVHCANGELLLSWYGQTGSTYNVYVIKSTDGGLTWGSPITVFSNTTSLRDETTFEHVGGGVIVGLMRGDSSNITYGQVISLDNGATWSYQGQVSFGISGTPAWLSAFKSQNGKMALACYYRVGTNILATYSYADSIILGPSHWDISRTDTIATSVQGSGYINICHPYQNMEGWGYYYDETVAQTNATIKWVKVPIGGKFPIGVGTGISGLTADIIPVATSATSLGNSGLKWSAPNTSIVGNGAAGNTWSAHNGLAIETAKTAMLFSDNSYINLMDNGHLDGDYKYKVSGQPMGLFAMVSGRLHFYNAPAGTAENIASLSERFRIGFNGDIWVNNSSGSYGQVMTSQGSGSPTTWTYLDRTLQSFYTDAGNTGTGETDLYTYTMPGATLDANGLSLTIEYAGSFTDASATPEIKLYFGGTVIYSSGVLTLTGTGDWRAKVTMFRNGGATIIATTSFEAKNTTITNTPVITGLGSLDFTSDIIIKVTGTATGAGGGTADILAKMGQIRLNRQQF
jgi:hypothetical protein